MPSSSTGRLLWRSTVLCRAHSHKIKCSALDQHAWAWSSCLRALSERLHMACLGMLFWKCKFIPQKMSFCCALWQACWKVGIAHCYCGNVQFWCCAWQRIAQRQVCWQLSLLMNHRLGGGQSVGGFSGPQRWLRTCSASWWVCLLIVCKNSLQQTLGLVAIKTL